jgi:hypothetical protein
MTSREQQIDLENTLRGIQLSIQFKEFLLSRDVNSRGIILSKCSDWFQLENSHSPSETNNRCYVWFQNMSNINQEFSNETRKEVLKSHITWGDLHYNLSKNLAFQKLVGVFLNGILPSDDLR